VSDRLRAFLAVTLPSEARARIAEAADRLRAAAPADARWVAPDHYHLTLKFLGEIREEDVGRLVERASAKLAPEAPFELAFAGFGAFPNAREARVLWLGATRGSGSLAKLARKLDAASRAIGAERERRPFAAHLTLARLREPARVEVERIPGPEMVAFSVGEVVLYESRPSPGGPRYVPLAHLPLRAGADAEDSEIAPDI
jgi:RNA 2',3'-cyclic 3'-phosphodiesterase